MRMNRALFTALLSVGVGFGATSSARADTPLAARLVIPDVLLNRPSFLVAPRGDATRIYVGEQTGPEFNVYEAPIRVFSLPCYQDLGVFVTVPNLIAGGEAGLIGMAFHPQYASNGRAYVLCTATPDAGKSIEIRLIRYQRDPANPDRLLTPGTTVLSFSDADSGHNGGWIDFGPDGYLYIAIGDGGNANDEGPGHIEPTGNAQNLTTLHGKLLRIDVDADNAPGGQYGIPPTNPFAATSNPTIRKEIWAYGLRNPWRNDIDPETGDLYIADVGQNDWEEISVQPADINGSQGGRNYGWRCYEADQVLNSNAGTCPPFGEGNVPPLLKIGHFWFDPVPPVNRHACAVMGGMVYRGDATPDLRGTYFFADWCFNWVFSVRADPAQNTFTQPTDRTDEFVTPTNMGRIVAFGRDGTGELYILAGGGTSGPGIWKIVAAGTPPGPCQCIGDFNNDRKRDITDLIQMLGSFGNEVTMGTNGDCNGDGAVNTQDLPTFLGRFGQPCP